MAFASHRYYPDGGMDDLVGSFDCRLDAEVALLLPEVVATIKGEGNRQIYDTQTCELWEAWTDWQDPDAIPIYTLAETPA